MATKRNFEGEGEDGNKKTKVQVEGEAMMENRFLIENPEASIIIGKAGANVKKIRESSGAFVSILQGGSTAATERVMVVKGTAEKCATAMHGIASLLIGAANERAQKNAGDGGAVEPVVSISLKLLLHKSLAGSVIGKQGAIIKQIMSDTGARLQLSQEPLPGSSEKSCAVTGTADASFGAFSRIFAQLEENPLKGGGGNVVLYVPGAMAPSPYGMPPPGYGAPPPGHYNPYQPPPQQAQYGAPPPQQAYGAPPQGGPPGSSKTEKIVIPTVCAGSVIGKQGTIIRDIKLKSGANITIADPEPTTPGDRVVAITGSSTQIQSAIFLIRQRVEAYTPPGAAPGGMPQAAHAQAAPHSYAGAMAPQQGYGAPSPAQYGQQGGYAQPASYGQGYPGY